MHQRNRTKDKKLTISENVFYKSNTLSRFFKKTLKNPRLEEKFLNCYLQKSIGTSYSKKLKTFLLRSRQAYPLKSLLFNIVQMSSQSNQARKISNKSHQDWKGKIKLYLQNGMIVHIEKSERSTRNILEVTNYFSKVLGYRNNTTKSIAVLYNSNKNSEN